MLSTLADYREAEIAIRNPFRETPKYYYYTTAIGNDDILLYATDHPSSLITTSKTGFVVQDRQRNVFVMFIGEVDDDS